jgi:hypothetical protein
VDHSANQLLQVVERLAQAHAERVGGFTRRRTARERFQVGEQLAQARLRGLGLAGGLRIGIEVRAARRKIELAQAPRELAGALEAPGRVLGERARENGVERAR